MLSLGEHLSLNLSISQILLGCLTFVRRSVWRFNTEVWGLNRFCLKDILYKFLTTFSRAKSSGICSKLQLQTLCGFGKEELRRQLWCEVSLFASLVPLTGWSEPLGHCRIHKNCHWVIMRHGFSRCFLSPKVFFWINLVLSVGTPEMLCFLPCDPSQLINTAKLHPEELGRTGDHLQTFCTFFLRLVVSKGFGGLVAQYQIPCSGIPKGGVVLVSPFTSAPVTPLVVQ